jgi:hypothetical protein
LSANKKPNYYYLVCSLPLYRHSYIGFILAFASSIHNKQLLFPNISGLASGRASTVSLCPFYFGDSWGNRPIFCFFRSSSSVITNLQFHYRHVVFSSQVKSKVGNILVTPLTLSNLSPLNLVSIFRCHRPPLNQVYVSRLDP